MFFLESVIYSFGFHLCPHIWQTFLGLPLPIKPVIKENPLLMVATFVEPHSGHTNSFFCLIDSFVGIVEVYLKLLFVFVVLLSSSIDTFAHTDSSCAFILSHWDIFVHLVITLGRFSISCILGEYLIIQFYML